MENYFETKRKFFHSGMVRNATFNADEETTARMLEGLEIPAMTYGICANADLYARDIEITENGVSFNMQLAGMHNIPVNLRLTGMFNVYNAIAAASMAMILDIPAEDIREGWSGWNRCLGVLKCCPLAHPIR